MITTMARPRLVLVVDDDDMIRRLPHTAVAAFAPIARSLRTC